MSKVYFTHTTKSELVKKGLAPAATIAIQKQGGVFIYGVSVCSKYDNFSKKSGREIAEARLKESFGTLEIPKPLRDLDDRKACLAQLHNLAASTLVHSRKWKKKVTKFNKAQEQLCKVFNISEHLIK